MFNRVYNSIPSDIKSRLSLAMLDFSDGFEVEIAYQLRERNLATLEDRQKFVVNVEANLLIKRASMEAESKEAMKEDSPPLSNHKLDIVMKTMGRMIENFMLQHKLITKKQQIRSLVEENFIEQEEVVGSNCFVVDSCCCELEVDDFIYYFVDSLETGFIDQHKKEQFYFSMFMVDDIAREVDFPKYDEYDDDFDVNFLEKPAACFQQSKEGSQLAHVVYDKEDKFNEIF